MGLIAKKVGQICKAENLTISEFALKYPHLVELLTKELAIVKGSKNEMYAILDKKQLLKG